MRANRVVGLPDLRQGVAGEVSRCQVSVECRIQYGGCRSASEARSCHHLVHALVVPRAGGRPHSSAAEVVGGVLAGFVGSHRTLRATPGPSLRSADRGRRRGGRERGPPCGRQRRGPTPHRRCRCTSVSGVAPRGRRYTGRGSRSRGYRSHTAPHRASRQQGNCLGGRR